MWSEGPHGVAKRINTINLQKTRDRAEHWMRRESWCALRGPLGGKQGQWGGILRRHIKVIPNKQNFSRWKDCTEKHHWRHASEPGHSCKGNIVPRNPTETGWADICGSCSSRGHMSLHLAYDATPTGCEGSGLPPPMWGHPWCPRSRHASEAW